MATTFREKIQSMIEDLQKIYDDAGVVRDYATLDEKEYLNSVRRELPGVWSSLQNLDNKITDARGAELISG